MLLSPLGARAPRAIRMPADTRTSARRRCGTTTRWRQSWTTARWTWRILGVGEDGHVCSLFPGHPALTQDDLRAVAIEDAPKPPRAAIVVDAAIRAADEEDLAGCDRARESCRCFRRRSTRPAARRRSIMLMRQAKDVTVFTDQTITVASEALQLLDERRSLQPQQSRRGALVLLGARQRALDHVLLDLRDERRQIDALRGQIERPAWQLPRRSPADPPADRRRRSACGCRSSRSRARSRSRADGRCPARHTPSAGASRPVQR